jgi:FkbM family methyltransferase
MNKDESLRLIRPSFRYRWKRLLKSRLSLLKLRYYQLIGKRTLSINGIRTVMSVTSYRDAVEIKHVYETERFVIEEILRELKPNDVFWDVGANLGFYSLITANILGVVVEAFEPHPTTVRRFKKNVEMNKKSNIKVLNLALSNIEGRARFDPIELHSSDGWAHLTSEITSGTIEVETSSGDNLINKGVALSPDIVKIDVEGAELLVVNGMRNALANCRALFCEVHPTITRYGSSAEDLKNTLEEMGFTLEIQNRRGGTYHLKANRIHKR